MNIIEKLGITPLPCYGTGKKWIFDLWEVKALEEQRNEMLEALIKVTILSNTKHDYVVTAIEKATGKTWTEIKELIND